jgi:hypothetical protein
MDAALLKARWVEILDHLESVSRAAWLAMFDGRIQSVSDGVISLDFSDATKFAGVHGYERDSRSDQFIRALQDSILAVTGEQFVIYLTQQTEPTSGGGWPDHDGPVGPVD